MESRSNQQVRTASRSTQPTCDCCQDGAVTNAGMPRREFLTTAGGRRARRERDRRRAAGRARVGAGESGRPRRAAAASTPESLVKVLYETLSPKQREAICFAWDHQDPERGLLRTRVANNWHITDHYVNDDDFYTKDQQAHHPQDLRGHHQPRVARADRQAARGRRRRLRRAEQHRHLRRAGQRASSSS